jgi:uncharacterized protein
LITSLASLGFVLLLQVDIPAPVGYVNDFAHVLDPASVAHADAVIAQVRAKTRGEIAVVTLPDIGDRAPVDVAVRIFRQWGVGARGEAGDPAKNLGVLVLVVPRKNHRPGTGHVFILTGRGAEGFLPDSRVGRIRDEMTPYLAREEYGAAVEGAVALLAQAFAQQFGVTLSDQPGSQAADDRDRPGVPIAWWIAAGILLILLTRGRILLLPFVLGGWGGGSRRWGGSGGGWGGGWGGGGGGGGGFGGFGGGGGTSGGGAGGSF